MEYESYSGVRFEASFSNFHVDVNMTCTKRSDDEALEQLHVLGSSGNWHNIL